MDALVLHLSCGCAEAAMHAQAYARLMASAPVRCTCVSACTWGYVWHCVQRPWLPQDTRPDVRPRAAGAARVPGDRGQPERQLPVAAAAPAAGLRHGGPLAPAQAAAGCACAALLAAACFARYRGLPPHALLMSGPPSCEAGLPTLGLPLLLAIVLLARKATCRSRLAGPAMRVCPGTTG